MAIFNSYVKLPEGRSLGTVWKSEKFSNVQEIFSNITGYHDTRPCGASGALSLISLIGFFLSLTTGKASIFGASMAGTGAAFLTGKVREVCTASDWLKAASIRPLYPLLSQHAWLKTVC